MRVVFFSQRLDAAPFVRGVTSELRDRGCDVAVFDGPPDTGLEQALDGADLVVAQDGIHSNLADRLGTHRIHQGRYRLLFHDRHPAGTLELAGFDGILAASDAIRDSYVRAGWSRTAWTWHEAADTSVFRPLSRKNCAGDVVWIADWVGADWGKWDHTSRLFEFLLDPVKDLDLRLRMYGADFPKALQAVLRYREVECDGPLANGRIPEILAAFRATVHLPRASYPGMQVFEALACGTPLVSAPWDDADRLFTAGQDYLLARTGEEMRQQLRAVMEDAHLCADLSLHGLQTILSRHTCAHRVDELISIYDQLTAAGAFNYAVVH